MRAKDSTKIRPLVLLSFAVIGTIVGILGWVFLVSSNILWVDHATLSPEAVAAGYKRGFRSFQLDLMLTRDDQVCVFSHWGPMDKELGVSLRFAELDERTFLGKKLFGTDSPICLAGLTALLKQYPDVSFVVDVKDSRSKDAVADAKNYVESYKRVFQKLFRQWAETREYFSRITPTIHSDADLAFLKSFYRFSSVAYSLDRSKVTEDAVLLTVGKHPEITSVVVDKQRFSKTLVSNLKALKRRLFVAVVNDPKEAKELAGRGATGFYTDTLEPKPKLD